MTHIDENTLELLVLGDSKVRKREKQLRQHLEECAGCRGLFEEIKSYYTEVELQNSSSDFPVSAMGQRALVRKRNELEPYFESPETHAVSYTEVKVPSAWRRIDQFRREHPVSSTFAVFVLAVGLALTGGYIWNALKPDSNPAYVHLNVQKGMMEVFNRENHLLWSMPGSNLQPIQHNMAENASSYWRISDLNSDGRMDLISIVPGLGSVSADDPVLQIFGPSGYLLRETNLSPGVISFSGRQYASPFITMNVLVTSLGKYPHHKEIFVGITNSHSPYGIVRLSHEGKILGTYWHFGFLVGMSMVKLADGKEYLVLCGENDVHDRTKTSFPVIVVLDPSKIVGTTESALTPGFDFKPSDAEVYYIKLPNSDMNYALHVYLAAQWLTGESNTQLTFNVGSGPSAFPNGISPSFGVTFSRRMAILSYNASNASITLHGELRNQGLVKGTIDKAYLDRLKNEVRYWSGDKWVKTPTRIKHMGR